MDGLLFFLYLALLFDRQWQHQCCQRRHERAVINLWPPAPPEHHIFLLVVPVVHCFAAVRWRMRVLNFVRLLVADKTNGPTDQFLQKYQNGEQEEDLAVDLPERRSALAKMFDRPECVA